MHRFRHAGRVDGRGVQAVVRSRRYGEQLALPFAWLLIIIFFSFKSPDLFPTTRNLGSLLGTQTALFILALAALLPAMAGDLDLSLGWAGAFAAMVMAVLNTQHGWGIVPAAIAGDPDRVRHAGC